MIPSMSRLNPLLTTPDFLTGDALLTFPGDANKPDRGLAMEWSCSTCKTLYIFGPPSPPPDEDCRSCGGAGWKAIQ